jgi:hypothetical protein
VRRFTLGILILGGGSLLALPFRRAVDPQSLAPDSASNRPSGEAFDDHSLQMLVQEVTEEVEVPVVYQPETDYRPAPSLSEGIRAPLTYDDLAVPLDPDPLYQDRFNASQSVVAERLRSGQSSGGVDQRIDTLREKFAGKEFVMTATPNSKTAGSRRVDPSARLTGTGRSGGGTQPANSAADAAKSVLSPLPPPTATEGGREEPPRRRHWIRQPE